MPPVFNRTDKYDPTKGYSRVRWGDRSKILDTELTEMQKILAGRTADIGRVLFGDGFVNKPALTYGSGFLTVPADTIVIDGTRIVITDNMTIAAGNGSFVYLAMWEQEVAYTDTVLRSGNQSGGATLADNGIYDSTIAVETSRRGQLQVQLVLSNADATKKYLTVASIAGGIPTDLRPLSSYKTKNNVLDDGAGSATIATNFTVNGSTTLNGVTMKGSFTATDATEHSFVKNNATAYHGFYVNDSTVGLYDWKNSRSVVQYNPVANTLNMSNSAVILGASATGSTLAVDTNTTGLATAAFVLGQAGSATPNMNGTAAVGTSTRYARQDHVHPSDSSKAPLASPTFTGNVSTVALVEGTYRFRKVLGKVTTTNAVANQKFDVYMPNGNFQGYIDISVSGNLGTSGNSYGLITKRFALVLANGGTVTNQVTQYEEAIGAIANNFAISDLTWDATNSRWRVQIVNLNSATATDLSVFIEGQFANIGYGDTVLQGAAVSAIYTTDATAFTSPIVSYSGALSVAGLLNLNGGGTIASGKTLTNNGTIQGGVINATSVPWGGVSSKPATLAGYGIVDAAPLASPTFTGVATMSGGLVIETRTTDPVSPAVGRMWLRTDL